MFVNLIPLKGKTSMRARAHTHTHIHIYDVLVIDGMHFGILMNYFFMNLINDEM